MPLSQRALRGDTITGSNAQHHEPTDVVGDEQEDVDHGSAVTAATPHGTETSQRGSTGRSTSHRQAHKGCPSPGAADYPAVAVPGAYLRPGRAQSLPRCVP